MNKQELIAEFLQYAMWWTGPDARAGALLGMLKAIEVVCSAPFIGDQRGFIYRAIVNGAKDHKRGEVRHEQRVKKSAGSRPAQQGRVTLVNRITRVEDQLAAREELLACCTDDFDRAVIELKLLGHTYKVVAKMLGSSQTEVSRRVRAMRQCLKERE